MRQTSGVYRSIENMAYGTFGFGDKAGMLTPDSVNSLKSAISGLNAEQAALALSTKGLTAEQQKQVLVEAGLLSSSERMSASMVSEALTHSTLSKTKQEELLIDIGLMNADTKEIISTNAVTESKLREALAEKGIKGAKADTLIASILQTGQNTKEALSWDVLRTKIKKAAIEKLKWLVTTPAGWATLTIGVIIGVTAAVVNYNKKLEESRQEMIETGKEAAKYTKDLDGLIEEYRKLGEDGKLDNSDREQAYNIQQQINELLGDEVDYINLANGKYEDQLKLLKKLQYQKANDKSSDIKDAKDSAEDSLMDKKIYVDSGFYKSATESEAISNLLQNNGFEKYLQTDINNQKKYFGYKADSVEDVIMAYNDMVKVRDIIRDQYEDEIKSGGELEDFYNNLKEKINELSDGVAKYKEAMSDYNINEAVKLFNETNFGNIKGAFIDSEEAMTAWITSMINADNVSDGVQAELIGLAQTWYPQYTKQINEAVEAEAKKVAQDALADKSLAGNIQGLKDAASSLGITEGAMIDLVLAEIRFNKNNLNVSQKISALKELAVWAGVAEEKIDSIMSVNGKSSGDEKKVWAERNNFEIIGTDKVDKKWTYNGKEYYSWAYRDKTTGEIYDDIDSANAVLLDKAIQEEIDKFGSVKINTPYTPTTTDKDNKPDYKDPTDAIINRINLRPKELEKQEQSIEDAIELSELGGDVDSFILGELNKLGDGGSVNLSLRPQIDTEELNKKGWDAGEGFATVFSSAISNTDFDDLIPENAEDTVAINFTPIIVDPATGEFKGVLSEDELYSYAHDVLAGVREDDLNLQIGAKFEGEDAIDKAVSAGERIHNLHEGLLAENDYEKQISLTNDKLNVQKQRVDALKTANDELHQMAEDLRNSTPDWDEESWFDSQGEATEAYLNLYNNSTKEQQEALSDQFDKLSKLKKAWYENDEDRLALEKDILDTEKEILDLREENFNKATDFHSSYFDSRISILEAQYELENSIAEARHELNKELETSKTMYEYLDEETRELLFNQEDYNELAEELLSIEKRGARLQRQYERDLENATLETVEEITANYERQYETLMKSYEIAKADLEIAKKKQQLNNVLNERNVRMFLDGQWRWVANTEEVARAKSELADAEYAKRVAKAGLKQQESINNLTLQQDQLGIVVKKFENGVITLDEAIIDAAEAIDKLPKALQEMYQNASKGSTSSSSGDGSSSFKGSSSGGGNKSSSSSGGNSSSTMNITVKTGDILPESAGGKITITPFSGGDSSSNGVNTTDQYVTSGSGIINSNPNWDGKKKGSVGIEKHADGTRYTPGGLTLMGEEGSEIYITASGRLIPINQPTIGNIPSGGVVFNREQMNGIRSLWDMSNMKLTSDKTQIERQPQQIDQSQDNRIIINGMTVDSGSSDGQALISALRRYVSNH